jgi:hypothetical protein
MYGKFTYRKCNEGWNVRYQGYMDDQPRLLCYIEKGAEGWLIPLPNGPLGPFKDRWAAGVAYLKTLKDPVSEKLEREIEARWRQNHTYRRDRSLTREQASAIYDVLVQRCKADNRDREKENFIYSHAEREFTPHEWRFGGVLGFGGKFWNTESRWYVSAYNENIDAETRLIIAETNEVLQKMFIDTFCNKTQEPAVQPTP